jgi:TctA family transporter
MFESIVAGLLPLLTPQALAFILVGTIYGLVVGILPGLGGVVAMALLLPFTYGFEVVATIGLLLGAHIATIWGSSVTSILFNVPGSAKSLPLCFDGYPMTRKGQATRALGASATAALLGGIIGAGFLAFIIPFVRPIMLSIGPSEYLMMAVWGLTIIAVFSDGFLIKGLMASALGIFIGLVGMDPVTATARFTFDTVFFLDGIPFPVAMIGLFAVTEMIKLYAKGGASIDRIMTAERSSVLEGVKDALRHRWLVARSGFLGLWIGVLPGVGASVGGIAAYALAVQTSKTPEGFGKGRVEGVIAPDATLGANEGGGLLPTLAFGIPGGESMAILLVAFINMGVTPGPQMLSDQLPLVFSLIWIIVFANVLVTVIGLAAAPFLARLPALHPNLMIPVVLSVCFIGAYATRGRIEDVGVATAFGVLGYFMDKYRYSRANLVIGMVLAAMIERNLHLSLTLYGDAFIARRPIALAILVCMVASSIVLILRKPRGTGKNAVVAGTGINGVANE